MNKIFYYYGLGIGYDQGGSYVGPTSFGSKSLTDLTNMLKYHLEQCLPELERLTQEKIDGRNP